MNPELNKAINQAVKAAKSLDKTMYVFYEGDGEYLIGDDFDAITFFNGNNPVCACLPNGDVER
jgi:hypothetical protein